MLVACAERSSRVTLCGFLVDVYWLGVKNTLGPQAVNSSAVLDRCGFPFADVEPFLGPAPGPCPVRFGPHDNPRQVIDTLERTVGAGHDRYLVGIPGD